MCLLHGARSWRFKKCTIGILHDTAQTVAKSRSLTDPLTYPCETVDICEEMAGAMTDDEVIKRRLLIEGDGGGDDRRIAALLRSFVKWCDSDDSADESQTQLQKMLLNLAQCEIGMEKTEAVCKMNELEQQNYNQFYEKIDQGIADAKNKITECKVELQQAKRIRKNRQEYDALARVIDEHPDREGTLAKLEALNKEMDERKSERQKLDEKLDLRRKQFHVLIHSIHEMQRILEEDKNLDEKEEGQEEEKMEEN